MAGPIPSVPKSICKSLASSAKNYFDRNINYAQPCPVYRSEIELTDLRTHVSASLALHYSNAFAAASIILFTPKNVNDFLKKIHKKANTSPEEESKEKELTRLSNVAAKLRKERAAVEKLEEDAARALRLEQLNRQADTADTVLARALQWVSLLFTQSGVALEGIVLLTSDENNLDVLKTDIDDIFNQLRGEASILSPRCLAIVLELERIMTLLRSHTCIQHMAPFLTPRHTGHAIVPSVVAPPKKHRGTTLGSKKWRNGDAQESRKGGIKFINLSVRNRADKLDKKANALLDLVAARAVEEEEILKKRTLKTPRRKSLMLSKEDAKKESLCPTKMQEKTDEQVEDMIQATAKELGELLQEQLQRTNNKHEGALLMTVPKGTITMLVADPSPILADGFSSHGVGKARARLFSDLLGQASHDCRQYPKRTKSRAQQLKYFLTARCPRVDTTDS